MTPRKISRVRITESNKIMYMNSPQVYIKAPARLHLGFLDLEGSLGRRFGSLGLTLDGIATRIVARRDSHFNVLGKPDERVVKLAERFFEIKGLPGGCEIEVLEQIPAHSGLGSGTQLALAVGTAISKLYSLGFPCEDIAVTLDRGKRSGVGIGAFQQGGFLLDAGKNQSNFIPPIVSRIAFPSKWRVVLIMDSASHGLYGDDESTSFSSLPPVSSDIASYLCRLTLMQIMPAVSEQDLGTFSKGIHDLQRCMSDFFASQQGGRYTSHVVGDAIGYIESLGIKGVGQSSWGPIGFAFVGSEEQALVLLRALQEEFRKKKELQFKIVSGRNTGAVVQQQGTVSLPAAAKF